VSLTSGMPARSVDPSTVNASQVDYVGVIELNHGPHNFISTSVLAEVVARARELEQASCRALVLCSAGKNFCAGADISAGKDPNKGSSKHIYDVAIELFELNTPIITAVQGKAVGAGVGLALVGDICIATTETRFIANFARLGFSHGFGMTETLVRAVGHGTAAELLYTGRAVSGDEALSVGLCSRVVDPSELRSTAIDVARQIAAAAPLAVQSIRRTLRGDLPGLVAAALRTERRQQEILMTTADFHEGVTASNEHRDPAFEGR
jgi:2-(1,2-epoxy-1,2-dihydrophenyl)acetyl-CoA isomerase